MSRRSNNTNNNNNRGSAKIPSPINRFLNSNNFLNSLTGGGGNSAAAAAAAATSSSLSTTSNSMPNNSSANDLLNPTSFLNIIDYEKVDKKLFDKTSKLIDKCVRLCQQEKLNLLNSPPYIIDILPDIYAHLNHISSSYENKMHILNEIDYFVIFMNNLFYKCEKVVKLFRDAGKKMFEEASNERKELIKYSLVFSHMLAELKSLFPNYIYEGLNFRIAKADAAEFWKNNFNEKIIVPWSEFHSRLNSTHQIHLEEAEQLRKTIQLTGTRYVSIFEFDIFTRLFQPWNTLLNNWKLLAIVHPAYGAFMTYDEVVKRLQNYIDKPGSYLFRLSCTKLGQWAIGYVTGDRKILQTIPQSLAQALIDGQKQGIYLYPDGRDIHIDLGQLAVASAERIKISREQYDMYCDMGTSFQLCKICSENNKDRKLEPCGHLICSRCLENWQEKNTVTASCPFCRCEIKAFEPIVISPFENANEIKRQSSIINNASAISSTNRNSVKINSNRNDTTDDSDQDSFFFTTNSNRQSKRSDILTASPPPPPPPPTLPIPPLPSRSSSSVLKKSNTTTTTSDNEHEQQEDYLKPSLKSNGSNSTDNLIGIIDMPTTSAAAACASSISTSNSQTNFPSKHQNSLQIKTNNSNTVLNVPSVPPPPVPPPLTIALGSLPPPPPISAPPPPIPSVSSLVSHLQATNNEQQSTVKVKIENERLLNHLVKLGYDRTKSACALNITSNSLELSIEILSKYSIK